MSKTSPTGQTLQPDLTEGSNAQMTAPKIDWRRVFSLKEMGVYYALLLLVLILSIATGYMGKSNYLSLQNVTNVFYQSSLIAMMAVAMTVVLISGNFDLSVASVAALAAAIMIGSADSLGFFPACALGMFAAIAVGLLNGSIVQYVGINAFIVTLGTLTAIRGLVLLYTDGRSLSVSDPNVIAAMKTFETGRVDVSLLFLVIGIALMAFAVFQFMRKPKDGPWLTPTFIGTVLGGAILLLLVYASGGQMTLQKPILYMAAFTSIVWFVLNFTTIGRRVYAVGGNAEAARLSGINVNLYRLGCFVLCSATAGFAGVLFASRLRSINPTGLSGAELTVIAAAILGGTSLFGGAGSVIRTLAGALLLYSLTNGFNILNLGANYQGLIEGIVLVSAAAIYTVGGSGKRPKTV
jgi:D-xylose transport system permease protein